MVGFVFPKIPSVNTPVCQRSARASVRWAGLAGSVPEIRAKEAKDPIFEPVIDPRFLQAPI
jgi:hypothetical protein